MTDEVRELVANLKDAADIIDNEGYAVCTESLDEAASLIERLAAENERKDAHIAQLELAIASWKREENEWEQERDQQEQVIERLREALEKYGEHRGGCVVKSYERFTDCVCGLIEAQRATAGEQKPA